MSALVIFPRIGKTPFHGDESDWISGGYYYTGLLSNGDFDWQKWACPECGPWGKINLQLGKWLIGIPLLADPATRAQPYMAHYNFDTTVEENRLAGSVPRPEILMRARGAPAFFGVLCCLLVFAIGFWAYNAWIGLIAASFLLGNSVFLMLASQAMTDVFYNFFLLSCCLALVALSKTADKKRAFLIVSACGILTALACSVKPTGILLGGAVFLLTVIHRYRLRKSEKREIVSMLAVFSFLALGTVYLLNPVFWPSWHEVRGKAILQELRSFSSEVVASRRMPLDHDAVTFAGKRYPQLRNLAHVLEFPMVFLRFDHSMQRQYAQGNWHGSRVLSVHRALFSLGPPLQPSTSDGRNVNATAVSWGGLTAVGILFLWGTRRLTIFESRDDSHLVPLLYLLVNYLLILAFLKLNWNRYYLPTIIAVDLIAAAGVYGVAKWGYRYLVIQLTPGLAKRPGRVSNAVQE
jgi:4-amino-4-deoxy-L-arabinose transferase-like glycosyltransferase